jgi:TonB family protein
LQVIAPVVASALIVSRQAAAQPPGLDAAVSSAADAGSPRQNDDVAPPPPGPPSPASDAAAPAPGPPLDGPQLTRAPRLQRAPEPRYPPEALAAGLSAAVTLELDLDAAGHVTAVAVTRPAGHGFDEAARDAAGQMTFEAAEIDGRPAAIRIEYVMHFQPAAPAPAAPLLAPDGGVPGASLAPPLPQLRVIVRGQVRERGTRDPVAWAAVSVIGHGAPSGPPPPGAPPEFYSTTNDEGAFEISAAVEPGTRLRVVVSSGEHEPCVRELVVAPAEVGPVEVACLVAPRAGPRYETVLSAPGEGQEATRHTISQPEMTTVPGTFGDPLRVIQSLPGVARSPYGLGLLIIRGSSPQDSGVFVDGHRVPLLYHFLGGPSVMTPDLIDRIDFYPGGFGVRYGRATAGVVDVTTRTEPVRRFHGAADVDFLDSSVYLEGPIGGQTAAGLAARRSYIDALLPVLIPRREGSSTAVVTPVYWDYQARITRPLGKGRLSLFAFGSNDSLKVVAADPQRGDIDLGTSVGFHRLIAAYAGSLGGWSSTFSPAYGYDHLDFGAGEVAAGLSSHVLELRHDLSRSVAPWFKLAVGLDGELRFDRFTLDLPMAPERRTYGRASATSAVVARSQNNLAAALYVEALVDLGPTVRLVPGVRGDWFRHAGEDRFSGDPRVVLRISPRPNQVFKLGAGIFHQPPQPQELDPEYGNPRLSLLWSDQYHAGIDQQITRALSLEATLYYLRRHDLPQPSSALADGRFERYASSGRGRSYGLELRLRHAVTEHFYGWISYTLSRSQVTTSLPTAAQPTPPYVPTGFDQTHNFILVASRRLRAWELGARFRLVTGIPETPILGSTYDADFNSWDPLFGPPRSHRRQTFHQLDLRVERTFTFDAWRFSGYLDVQNVYNAQNPEATLYDYRYQNQAPVRGLPILPVLGLKGRF